MAAVAFLGFLDATYLSLRYIQGVPPTCTLLHGCEIVTTSRYAAVGPIPVAFLGAAYYLTILTLAIGYLDFKRLGVLRLASSLTVAGLIASTYLMYLQLSVLKALCPYCLFSAASSVVLFVIGLSVLVRSTDRAPSL